MTSRETYYGALMTQLAKLKASGAISAIDRLVRLQDATNPPVMPCIYLDTDKETVEHQAGQPARVTLTCKLFVYVAGPDRNAVPGTALSNLLDAIDSVLAAPIPGMQQTLGGLVSHCWVEGEIERFEAGIDNLALAIVPVHMMVVRF